MKQIPLKQRSFLKYRISVKMMKVMDRQSLKTFVLLGEMGRLSQAKEIEQLTFGATFVVGQQTCWALRPANISVA